MFDMKYLLYFILIHHINSTPQINLYYTDTVTEVDHVWQHDCLRTVTSATEGNLNRQLISYCISESFAALHFENDDAFSKFTFANLSEQNVTGEQLYIWSAPIDLIERYQLFLNQLSASNKSFTGTDVFYNCTLPRFGPRCQYEFVAYHPNYSSLYEMIYNFYHNYAYNPITLTCYLGLQCNRGPSPACLDWSEICDGKVDCLDSELDEEHCWQLDMNRCNENEYQCYNGQCIPRVFFRDDPNNPDCLDKSDEVWRQSTTYSDKCHLLEPSFGCEDVICDYTPLTSSCVKQRKYLLMETMYSTKDSSVLDECWSAFKCILAVPDPQYPYYVENIAQTICLDKILSTCPDILYVPNIPVLFGQIYTAYTKSDALSLGEWGRRSPYLCYNNSRYDDFIRNSTKIVYNGSPCYRPKVVNSNRPHAFSWDEKYHTSLNKLFYSMKKLGRVSNYSFASCDQSNVYHCINSTECIRNYRIMDNFADCPYADDENIFTNDYISDELEEIKRNYYKCQAIDKYIHQSMIGDGSCDCGHIHYPICEDEDMDYHFSRKNISFQNICDRFIELSSINLQGTNQTDESECEQWSCNNIYTRCDGLWNCLNGEDEIDCDLIPLLNCSSTHHICVSPVTYQLKCLPIEKANDGHIDCLGGTDEPTLCPMKDSLVLTPNFYCSNQTSHLCIQYGSLCDWHSHCPDGDDERFCEKNRTVTTNYRNCHLGHGLPPASNTEKFMCHFMRSKNRQFVKHFTIEGWRKTLENVTRPSTFDLSVISLSEQYQPQCHRGLDLRVWFNNSTRITCLCPPSYSGNRCQYQNERIGLSLRFRSLSDSWQTLFAMVIALIDDDRMIHSSEQLTYLSVRDCQTKFQLYLLYGNRSKNVTRNYFIHIDIFEKSSSLTYRGSLLFPIHFPFLPVHRLGFIVDIPAIDDRTLSCSNKQCIHGKCIKYSNNRETFCQCREGWSGKYCTFEHNCRCSSGSKCLPMSTANHRSICICPRNKFGSQCRLINDVCQTQCQHNGTCIPNDEYMQSNSKLICLCAKGYSGDRCEIIDNKLLVSFSKEMILSRSIFIHFIEILENQSPMRGTTVRMFSGLEDTISIYWSRPFHLVFIEIPSENYYLTVVQKIYNRSTVIEKTIQPSHRCPHINQLLNESIVQLDLLRRIKYYHLACQNQSLNPTCFYDDVHLCLCYNYGQKRLANCFIFNHQMKYDCSGRSECQHDGQCFQDSSDCPKRSICVCRPCFYGRRCQFTTSGFGLSLDAILGYHILPHTGLIHQSLIVKFSLILAILFLLGGLIDGILSVMTFKNQIVREIGCGYYLLGSSMTTLFVAMIFTLKFVILLLAQMALISNRSFLQVQCQSVDFLLRIGLYMDQWLNVCVAIERSVTIIQGIHFSKKKSRQTAKRVICILFIVIIGSTIHDPIHRRLIDEDNNDYEKRIWCMTNYSSRSQVYDSLLTTFHFFVPFIINLISAIILITMKSRQRLNVHNKRSYKEIVKEHLQEHKHLFTAPVVLVILAIPRLVISYTSKCMNSLNDSWIFLIGYFISFIPSMLTFIVFVLPSKVFTNEFTKTFTAYRNKIRACFNWRS